MPPKIPSFEVPDDPRGDVSLTDDLRRLKRQLTTTVVSSVAQARADVARQTRAFVCMLNLVDAGVKVRDGRAVNYLADHNSLIPVVMIVVRKAKILGPSDDLTIETYRDRETGDEYLSLIIRRPVYDETLMILMDVLQDLGERNMQEASGWLLVTTDFRPSEGPEGHDAFRLA